MKLFIQAHFFVGIAFFVLFLLTGVYMILNFPELYEGREEIRMMYRATHIYILMSSLVNLMPGNYLLGISGVNLMAFRKIASLLILVTPLVFFTAFIVEPPEYLIERPIAFWGVVLLVTGVILHTLLNLKWLNRNAI